jgi:predicted membrane metal-binding protein
MSEFSLLILAAAGTVVASGFIGLILRSVWQAKQIKALEVQLNIFVDTSISVAQSVDRLIHQSGSGEIANVASRRWVLQEAKTRMAHGESVLDVAAPLGLSKDEVRLLNAQLH